MVSCSWVDFTTSVYSFFYPSRLEFIVCGPLDSGKSSFIKVITGKKFEDDTIPTENHKISSFVLEDFLVKCFDFGGQRRFQKSLFDCLYKNFVVNGNENEQIIVFVLDYSEYLLKGTHDIRLSDFERLKNLLKKVILKTYHSKTPVLILGNKLDLAISGRSLSTSSTQSNSNINQTPTVRRSSISSLGSPKKNDSSHGNVNKIPNSNSNISVNSLASLNQPSSLLNKKIIKQYYRTGSSDPLGTSNARARKNSPLYLPEIFSLNQLANDLGIFIKENTNTLYLRIDKQDFINDKEFFKLFKTMHLFSSPALYKTVNEIPDNYSIDLYLNDRDFAIMLTSFKTGEGLQEVIEWILSDY